METLKTTPLIDAHRRLGARLAPFGGWLMPIQYESILAEHRWCRESAALFDTCHMGEFVLRGDLESAGMERLFSFRLDTLRTGRCRYGFLLNEEGGIIDDLTVYRTEHDGVMIVVNAGPAESDGATIRARLPGGASLEDRTFSMGKLDIQGPRSREILIGVLGREIADIPFFGFRRMHLLGSEGIVSRTGYTGELGYEIYLESDRVAELWQALLEDDRVKPAGLGARDLLRLEMGYNLYGSDLDESTTPLEADLERFVDFSRDFEGREALLRQRGEGLSRLKVAFRVSSRRSPRHGYGIFSQGKQVGTVTSGAFSPMLGCGIGMGYVTPESALPGASLEIRHEDVSMEATVVELPFYREGSLRE
jgi:aminomethyltransferase